MNLVYPRDQAIQDSRYYKRASSNEIFVPTGSSHSRWTQK